MTNKATKIQEQHMLIEAANNQIKKIIVEHNTDVDNCTGHIFLYGGRLTGERIVNCTKCGYECYLNSRE